MEKNLLFETKYWELILHEDQTYLGRCVLASKTEKKHFSEFTNEEAIEMFEIMKKTEVAMIKAFDATHFNWTALNNDAYKEDNPHKYSYHIHLRPRYSHSVIIGGYEFKDPNFAHHYERYTDTQVSEDIMELIRKDIQKFLLK